MAVLVYAALACARPVVASQQSIDYGSLSGRVTDPQGGVIPGAQVTARQIETNVSAETVTDVSGRFRFAHLRVGPYELKVHIAGFNDLTQHLSVTAGSAFDLPLTLAVAGISASIVIVDKAPLLEAARSQIAGTVEQPEIRQLPMNGRNFLDLALLVPGVSPTNIGTTQLFAETSAVPGQGISVSSQRNLSNNFIVDGLSANDDAAGLTGMPYGVDAIEQFQVVTAGAQAELGRALGGYINVVTKSGTNSLHGGGYGFIRDDSLNAANALSGTKLPMNQQQFGGSIGGPIVRSRAFYFGNVEGRLLDQTGLVTIQPDNVPIINARLSAAGYAGLPVTTGIYPNPVHSTNVLGKVDHNVNDLDRFSVKYTAYRVTSDNSRGAGALNAPSASTGLSDVDQSIALANMWVISPRTMNETRAQFTYGDLEAPPADPIGPAVNISGIAVFGTAPGAPAKRLNRMYQVVDNVTHYAGGHSLRAGVDVLFNDDTITFPRSVRGSYSFSSLANFLSGNYSGFTQTFGDPVVSQRNPNIALFAQDEWLAMPSLTINLGVRYDRQFLDTITTDTNNVSPRIGFAWSPMVRSFVVRGSAGLFFDRVPLRAVANAILSAGNTTDVTNLHQPSVAGLIPAQDGAPTFPNILPARILTTTRVDFTTMDRRLQNAYARQASLEVERSLGANRIISAGYQYVRGDNLLMQVNQNVATCVAAGTNNGCRPNADYRNNNQYSSSGTSNYHGAHVSFVQRPTASSSLRVTYTLSKSMNNVGEAFFSSPIDPTDIMRDWGRSDDDQRHRLVINGSVNTPMSRGTNAWQRLSHGFQLSGIVQYYSPLPLNITSGIVSLQGTTARPLANGGVTSPNFDVRSVTFIRRNAGIGNNFFTLNLRLSRVFQISDSVKIEGLLEGFNVTNRANPLTRNTNFGSGAYPSSPVPTFNTITTVGDPRTFQVGARLTF